MMEKNLGLDNSRQPVSQEEKEIARKRFESHFGEVQSTDPKELDNETIDADLAREYSSNHTED